MPRFLIDPPNGHAFGFPKLFEGEIETVDLDAWLREHGYPDNWIKMFPDGEGCRIVEQPDD